MNEVTDSRNSTSTLIDCFIIKQEIVADFDSNQTINDEKNNSLLFTKNSSLKTKNKHNITLSLKDSNEYFEVNNPHLSRSLSIFSTP